MVFGEEFLSLKEASKLTPAYQSACAGAEWKAHAQAIKRKLPLVAGAYDCMREAYAQAPSA